MTGPAVDHGADAETVCRTFLASAPVDGAAFTAMDSDTVRGTWFVSDPVIAEVERWQYALGEGPTRDAFTVRRPVLVPDLAEPSVALRWPMLVRQTASMPVGALFAIPMQVGAIGAGVCLAYRQEPGPLSVQELRDLLTAVDAATIALLAIRSGNAGAGDPGAGTLSREIHQATGMVVAQLRIGPGEAFARIRAHAYSAGRSLDEVAGDIVERRLRLEADPPHPNPPSRSDR